MSQESQPRTKARLIALAMLGLSAVSTLFHISYFEPTFGDMAVFAAWATASAWGLSLVMELLFHSLIDDFARALTTAEEWVGANKWKSIFFVLAFGIGFIFYVKTAYTGADVGARSGFKPPPPPAWNDPNAGAIAAMDSRIDKIELARKNELERVNSYWAKQTQKKPASADWFEKQRLAAVATINRAHDKRANEERTTTTKAITETTAAAERASKEAGELWQAWYNDTQKQTDEKSGLMSWITVFCCLLNAVLGIMLELDHKANGTTGGNPILNLISDRVLSFFNGSAKLFTYILALLEPAADRLPDPRGVWTASGSPDPTSEAARLRRNAAVAKSRGYQDTADRLNKQAAELTKRSGE